MQDNPIQSAESTAPPAACRHLRCKEMYYHGSTDDEFASGIFWCVRTQENMGPDGRPCDKCDCGPARACYQE